MKVLAVAAALAAPLQLGAATEEGRPYAVSGERAIVATAADAAVSVRSQPLTEGAPSTPVATITVPPDQRSVNPSVAASTGRLAVDIATEDDEQSFRYTGVFAGPPAGPLDALAPIADTDQTHQITQVRGVSGDRVFTVSVRDDFKVGFTYTAHEPDGTQRPVRLPKRALDTVFAGDHAAYTSRGRLVVADWASGEMERQITPFDPDRGWDLRDDGAVAFVRGGALFVAAPGTPPRRLAAASESEYGGLAWAGDRVVLRRHRQLFVIGLDGTARRLGPPSASIDDVVADADHVLWSANACILAAAVTDGPADAPGPGPCLRTEMNEAHDIAVRHVGRVSIRLRCIAGPGGFCRGTVQLARHGKARSRVHRFRVPVGTTRFHRFRRRGTVVRRVIADPGGRHVLERQPVLADG